MLLLSLSEEKTQDRDTQGEFYVTTEAEIGVIWPQTKEQQVLMTNHQKLQERQESILPYRFQRRAWHYQQLAFILLSSRAVSQQMLFEAI